MKKNSLNRIFIIGGVIIVAEVILGMLFIGVFTGKNKSKFSEIVLTEYNRDIKEDAIEIAHEFSDIRDFMTMSAQVANADPGIIKSPGFLSVILLLTLSAPCGIMDVHKRQNTAQKC